MNYSTEVLIALTLALVSFLFLLSFFRSNKLGQQQPWNWPFIGMLHLSFPISTNIFDNLTNILDNNKGTFLYKGPWFSCQNMIITCDPKNFHHVLSSKFSNYPKGSDTYTMFEPYGEFLFSLDSEEWRRDRKILHGVFSDQGVRNSHPKVHMEILKNGMIPVLDYASRQALVLDLKEVFKRLFLDITIMSATGYNHKSLCIEFRDEPVLNAIVNVNHGILFRHALPEKIWKFQRWLGIGQEKKVIEASKIVDQLVSKYDKLIKKEEGKSMDQNSISTISLLPPSKEKLKREFIKSSLFASVDTTGVALTWFFWLIHENPTVENKIRQEIETKLLSNNNRFEISLFIDPEELNKLVYLHGALLETLRLYPSIPLQSRTCDQTDILPSGHHVESQMKVILDLYAMARMKSIWGEDCCEYKPERWIFEDVSNGESRIVLVPSTKFCSFSSGPRICPGKELSILRLKSIVATIIHNYDIQLLKDYTITPSTQVVLEMKYPLHAKIRKR